MPDGLGLRIGLPAMRKEPGERRAFLPSFVARMVRRGAHVLLEHGYGATAGINAEDFLKIGPGVQFGSHAEAYQQDYVLVLRCPADNELRLMRPGACLMTMAHYPTRPQRVKLLRELGLEAISFDSIKDDSGRRMIENLRSVAWNGVEAAFRALGGAYPDDGFASPARPPIRVLLLGAGAVGSHVMQAAIRYGDEALRAKMAAAGAPGVRLTVVDYDLTGVAGVMCGLLADTDLLIDATQRPDPARPVIPNACLAHLPPHAVLLDLSVDPYDCQATPPFVKGIEGIPQGSLDKYIFHPDDPEWDKTVPASVPSEQRRTVSSCYSWPGIHPEACMRHYAQQLQPLMEPLLTRGYDGLSLSGGYFERALCRATLTAWVKSGYYEARPR